MLGHSHLPFSSQVPCWILKDYMMKKCAPQITYRSMQFLTFPHVLDSSVKIKFIAFSLTFQMFRLRGILWNENKTNNQIFTQGKRIEGAGKEADYLRQIGLASVGQKMRAAAGSVCLSPELVLPGQAHSTRNSRHSQKGYMDSLSENLCRQPVLRSQHSKGQQQKEMYFSSNKTPTKFKIPPPAQQLLRYPFIAEFNTPKNTSSQTQRGIKLHIRQN